MQKTTHRKILSLLMSLAMILTALPLAGVTAFAETIGDVDGNGRIAIADAKWILQYTVNSRTFSETQTKAADLNKDGKLSVVDAKWILQIITDIRDQETLELKTDVEGEPVNPDEAVILRANKDSEKVNETIVVYLDIKNITGIEATIKFDTESFVFINEELKSSDMLTVINTNNASDGCVKIAAAAYHQDFNGTVAEFSFKYKGGNGVISADIEDVIDFEDNSIPLDPVSITITEDSAGYYPEDFEYEILEDGTAEITDYTGNAEVLEIPSKLGDYTVKNIGYGAFAYCDSLTSVIIPDSVTYIMINAFACCDSLTSITIPNSVIRIGDEAFSGCSSLTNITIPNSITNISNSTFRNCESLTNITIPESVISIGDEAFLNTGYYNNPANWQNGALYIDNCLIEAKSDKIPQNYKINEETRVIAYSAFEDCDRLTSVTIPESVTDIGGFAFKRCESLNDIYILNKECYIIDSESYYKTIPSNTTIHGYAGSTAETFAKENGNKFVAIDGEPVTPDPGKQNAIGDVDGNKNITITDAKWILQNTVKSRNLTEAQAKAADLNKDGKVTIVDAKWVLQIVVGLRDAQTLKPIKK